MKQRSKIVSENVVVNHARRPENCENCTTDTILHRLHIGGHRLNEHSVNNHGGQRGNVSQIGKHGEVKSGQEFDTARRQAPVYHGCRMQFHFEVTLALQLYFPPFAPLEFPR